MLTSSLSNLRKRDTLFIMTNTIVVVNDRNKTVLGCYYVQCHARCFYTHHLVNFSQPYETGIIVDSMLQMRIVSSREVLDLVHSYIAVGTEFSPRQSNVMDCDFNNCTELVCAYVYMCM